MGGCCSVSEKNVRQATQTAKRMVLLSFMGLGVIMLLFLAERLDFHRQYRQVMGQLRQTVDLSRELVRHDRQMDVAIRMAISTGQPEWAKRYEQQQTMLTLAVGKILARVPDDIGRNYKAKVLSANMKLTEAELRALGYLRSGKQQEAYAVLSSAPYAANRRAIAQASEELVNNLRLDADRKLQTIQWRSWTMLGSLILATVIFFVMIWRRLKSDMGKSEAAYALAEARLQRLASHDALTGLPNRQRLIDELQQLLIRSERSGQHIAVIALDLDRFRPINDEFGHDVGDQVLREVGRRIAAGVRQDELAGRLGADEFVIAITCWGNRDAPILVARRIIQEISAPLDLEGLTLEVGATAGIAFWPDDSALPDELLRKADIALARAKAESRGDVRCFQPAMDAELRERSRLQTELKLGIAEGQIVPYFQPVVDLGTGAILGFEVLARWEHPTRGIISPVNFISFAEDAGLIGDLTFAVMRSALRAAKSWPDHLTIAVNISQKQLHDPWLAEKLLAVLAECDFPAHRFEVEVTENALASDIRMAKYILHSLKSHGVCISLDDFGTGYSCLGHLAQLPVDKIKIDRSFTRTMGDQAQSATIVKSILGLGRSLGLPVIAEGIETAHDAAQLLDMGCVTAQGYYFSPPVAGNGVKALFGYRLGYSRPGQISA